MLEVSPSFIFLLNFRSVKRFAHRVRAVTKKARRLRDRAGFSI